jgi:hypothetical protein
MTDGMIMAEPLAEELATFDAHRDELLGSAPNKFVLIKGSEILGTYETETDAINEGYRKLGNVPFLVKHIVESERPLNFVSGVIGI